MTTIYEAGDHQQYPEDSGYVLEWTVRGLKQLFDASSKNKKSKATRSIKFGNGRWQVVLYPNAGAVGGWISVYLEYKPTKAEVGDSPNGHWVAGLHDFAVEIKTLDDVCPIRFIAKDAYQHTFSFKSLSWGWNTFIKRDVVYYAAPMVVEADAFKIVCRVKRSGQT